MTTQPSQNRADAMPDRDDEALIAEKPSGEIKLVELKITLSASARRRLARIKAWEERSAKVNYRVG